VPAISDAEASRELDSTVLTDPVKIQAFRDLIGGQLNQQSNGPRFEDLSDRISDIQIETMAQGASTLKVTVIDPLRTLLISGFIQADVNGYLWPPIDINFPAGTDCWWRLAQVTATVDYTQPNVTLTFEDRIVSLLRQCSPVNTGVVQGAPNQTLGSFIGMLVDTCNRLFKLKPQIRMVQLISPQDPNYLHVTSLPSSAQRSKPLRQNPNKLAGAISPAQQAIVSAYQQAITSLFGPRPKGTSTTMSGVEGQAAGQAALGSYGWQPVRAAR
jgi:hypothetical protein